MNVVKRVAVGVAGVALVGTAAMAMPASSAEASAGHGFSTWAKRGAPPDNNYTCIWYGNEGAAACYRPKDDNVYIWADSSSTRAFWKTNYKVHRNPRHFRRGNCINTYKKQWGVCKYNFRENRKIKLKVEGPGGYWSGWIST